jgi:hypothetical protein
MARAISVYRAVLISVSQTLGTPANSGPVSGVQAMANAQAAISAPIPAEAATVWRSRLAGPLASRPAGAACSSAAAQASSTAVAIPAQNQIISGGSVPSNHSASRGCWVSTAKPNEEAPSTARPASSRRARRATSGGPGGPPRLAAQVRTAAISGSTR